MKYILPIQSGFSINDNSELPEGAITVNDEQYAGLKDGLLTYQNGNFIPVVIDSTPPVKTLTEQAEDVRIALQSAIDVKAKSFGFSGGNALMLYVGFTNPFQSLAQVFATWEANVWVEAETYKAQVIAGTMPMLTGAEAVAMMPAYPA